MKKINLTAKITVYTLQECTNEEKKLIEAAKKSTLNAYAPYSGFHVGAALLLENGEIITGNNQENAAYPSGLCAERTAIFYANACFPDQPIKAVAIAANYKSSFTKKVITPCGACRQVILEVENRYKKPVKIMMYGKNEVYMVETIHDLLPLSFDEEML